MVLSGPAGSAKTATVRVLAKEMGIELVEYRNSDGDGGTSLFVQSEARLTRRARPDIESAASLSQPRDIGFVSILWNPHKDRSSRSVCSTRREGRKSGYRKIGISFSNFSTREEGRQRCKACQVQPFFNAPSYPAHAPS
jgi:hypothetical protein